MQSLSTIGIRLDSTGEQQPMNRKDRAWQQMRIDLETSDSVDLNRLRTLSWHGVPTELRPQVWQLLLGYCPPVRTRRDSVLNRKRAEYKQLVQRYFDQRAAHEDVYRQIHIDIPRMQPLMRIFQQVRNATHTLCPFDRGLVPERWTARAAFECVFFVSFLLFSSDTINNLITANRANHVRKDPVYLVDSTSG